MVFRCIHISPKLKWFSGAKISLDKVANSINTQTHNESPGNDGLIAEL